MIHDIKELSQVTCLIWCEGPMMELARADTGQHFIVKWADMIDFQAIYLVYPVDPRDVKAWMAGRISLRGMELMEEHYLLGNEHGLEIKGFPEVMPYLADSDSPYDPQFAPPGQQGLDLPSNRSIM